jgi:hypothetical protein
MLGWFVLVASLKIQLTGAEVRRRVTKMEERGELQLGQVEQYGQYDRRHYIFCTSELESTNKEQTYQCPKNTIQTHSRAKRGATAQRRISTLSVPLALRLASTS